MSMASWGRATMVRVAAGRLWCSVVRSRYTAKFRRLANTRSAFPPPNPATVLPERLVPRVVQPVLDPSELAAQPERRAARPEERVAGIQGGRRRGQCRQLDGR